MPIANGQPDLTDVQRLADTQTDLQRWSERMEARAEQLVQPNNNQLILVPADTEKAAHSQALDSICHNVQQFGYAHYVWQNKPTANTDISRRLRSMLCALSLNNSDKGVLHEADELSLLQDMSGTAQGKFPPYQSKAMSWHTDGYYNAANQSVRCFSLHCIEPAAQGGALHLMDDELLAWLIFKDNPAMFDVLSHPEAMTLPQNKDDLGHNRPDRTVAMINRHPDATVSMRFTTRTKNIHWRCSKTRAAAGHASELINQHKQWHVKLRLERGEGIIARNVLHTREPFQDASGGPKRQILRGRFQTLPTQPALASQ